MSELEKVKVFHCVRETERDINMNRSRESKSVREGDSVRVEK